jgi:hypothetical protein
VKCSKASGTSKSKGVKKRTKSDPIYSKTLPKAAMGTRIELGQREDTDGASLMELGSMRGDAYGKMADE